MARYRYGRRRSRRVLFISLGLCVILALGGFVGWRYLQSHLKPHTELASGKATTTRIDYKVTTKKYNEPNFVISLPATWKQMTLPASSYRMYAWQLLDKGTSQQLTIYEDTIPAKLAVNRVLMVEGQNSTVSLLGQASDNCANFADGTTGTANGIGVKARWQGIDFWCDRSNIQRDVIGTSSAEGINTVSLTTSLGQAHRYFFTFTNTQLNPDYTVFYNALQSFHMQ